MPPADVAARRSRVRRAVEHRPSLAPIIEIEHAPVTAPAVRTQLVDLLVQMLDSRRHSGRP